MGNYYDLIEGLKAAWIRWRNPELLKWVAIEFALGLVVIVLALGVLAAMVGPDTLIKLANGGSSKSAAASGALATALAAVIVPFIAILLVALLIYGLFCFFFFQPRIMRAALAANGAKVPAKLPSMLDWLVLHLRIFCVTISCWYDKKLLAPAAGFLALTILCAVAGFFVKPALVGAVAFGMLTLVCWLVASSIQGLRAGFAPWMFLRGDGPENQMPAVSNELVHGQTLEVFIANFFFGLAFGLVAVGVAIVRVILGFIPYVGSLMDLLVNLAFNVFTQAFSMSIGADIFLFFDKAGPVNVRTAPASKKKK